MQATEADTRRTIVAGSSPDWQLHQHIGRIDVHVHLLARVQRCTLRGQDGDSVRSEQGLQHPGVLIA